MRKELKEMNALYHIMVFGDGKMTSEDWSVYNLLIEVMTMKKEPCYCKGGPCSCKPSPLQYSLEKAQSIALPIMLKPRLEERRIYLEQFKNYNDEVRGYEKCLQLCLNFPKEYNTDDVKKIIDILQNWEVKWLRGAQFVCEFWTKTGWNPHIHIWLKYTTPSIVKGACKKKFDFNCYVAKGHKNLLEYVKGTKREDKEADLLKDKEWRDMASLNNSYIID